MHHPTYLVNALKQVVQLHNSKSVWGTGIPQRASLGVAWLISRKKLPLVTSMRLVDRYVPLWTNAGQHRSCDVKYCHVPDNTAKNICGSNLSSAKHRCVPHSTAGKHIKWRWNSWLLFRKQQIHSIGCKLLILLVAISFVWNILRFIQVLRIIHTYV